MTTEGNVPYSRVLPIELREIQERVRDRTDAVLHEGLAELGVDTVLEHVFTRVIPAAFDPASPATPRASVRFVLGSPAGERAWVIERAESGLTTRPSTPDATDPVGATASMTLANFLRVLASEKTIAEMLGSHGIHATGDEALVRAVSAWLKLPT